MVTIPIRNRPYSGMHSDWFRTNSSNSEHFRIRNGQNHSSSATSEAFSKIKFNADFFEYFGPVNVLFNNTIKYIFGVTWSTFILKEVSCMFTT